MLSLSYNHCNVALMFGIEVAWLALPCKLQIHDSCWIFLGSFDGSVPGRSCGFVINVRTQGSEVANRGTKLTHSHAAMKDPFRSIYFCYFHSCILHQSDLSNICYINLCMFSYLNLRA